MHARWEELKNLIFSEFFLFFRCCCCFATSSIADFPPFLLSTASLQQQQKPFNFILVSKCWKCFSIEWLGRKKDRIINSLLKTETEKRENVLDVSAWEGREGKRKEKSYPFFSDSENPFWLNLLSAISGIKNGGKFFSPRTVCHSHFTSTIFSPVLER